MNWEPTASIEHLKKRADVIKTIRRFFEMRKVLEVETPVLSHAAVTDIHLQSIQARSRLFPGALYLQTSPEYAMKRLLAAGSGAIFQIGKAFRDDEVGRYHNTEFTMLEWYRPGWDHHALMQEMNALLKEVLGCPEATKLSYREAFLKYVHVDPWLASIETLRNVLLAQPQQHALNGLADYDRDILLQLLMSNKVEPHLAQQAPVFIYDYPTSQAALAKLRKGEDGLWVAERFEVYFQGIELANGFHELLDEKEQRERFQQDLSARKSMGYEAVPIDERLLAALKHGLPACSGVALGIDRLVMLALGARHIQEVISFPINCA